MKRSLLAALLLFTAQLSLQAQDQAQNRVGEIRSMLANPANEEVLVVAHRGAWRLAPENSLAAINSAIDIGVDIVEIDIQRSSDGVLVLMHDKTLDRTTNGRGAVKDHSLEELRELRLKDHKGAVTGHRVPTLEEALTAAKGKVMLNLDKAYPYFDEVYALLKKTGTADHVIMKGSRPVEEVQQEFGAYLNELIYMPIVNLGSENAEEMIGAFLSRMQPEAFELVFESPANPLPKKVKEVIDGKSLIWYNTLWDSLIGGHTDDLSLKDPKAGYGYVIDTLGADIIQTDRPVFLIQYLESRGLKTR